MRELMPEQGRCSVEHTAVTLREKKVLSGQINRRLHLGEPAVSDTSHYAWFALELLMLTTALNVADRNLLPIRVRPIQQEFPGQRCRDEVALGASGSR